MKLRDFNYILPEQLIAQYPLKERGQAKLLVLNRAAKSITHCRFCDIYKFFEPSDVLAINNTKVFKARLRGKKTTGGAVEVLLIKQQADGIWESMVSNARRVRPGTQIFLGPDAYVKVIEKKGSRCLVVFNISAHEIIAKYGIVPLPHYIKRSAITNDEKYYQTTFAEKIGSIAAPTAGLHFTKSILSQCEKNGAQITETTLHIGPGTFKPIRTENIEEHEMEAEYFEISQKSIKILRNAKRLFGVGTSVCRSLETYAHTKKTFGFADLFIYPGHKFKIIDCLITNFHLPCSTPLLLVCAFAGKNLIFKAYEEAIQKEYRFLSYGDAMLII
ncbi:MAG: tRNA preQ1(34) S-adenosylmethionine ribosyltransferase-isomerase QueA [bacterium]